jgi:membrane dipeptidase
VSPTPIPLIFDGHNDTLLTLYLRERGPVASFFTRSDQGHIDLPRAREGGFGGGFFAVWVPPERAHDTGGVPLGVSQQPTRSAGLDPTYSLRVALGMAAILFRIEAQSHGQLRVIRTVGEIERCLADGSIGAILHFEGAEAIDPELNALEVLYQAGLRSLGIVWSRPNAFAEGVPFEFPSSPDTGPGLTEAGKELVRACNRLGVMLDLSHLNEKGFWDVAALTDAPLVATHSNVHALCPSARNLTDRQLAAIKESDGMVGLNYHVGFTRADGERNPDTPLELYVDHLDYLVSHLGIDRVGLGSDFDGCTIPTAIGDVTGQPKLLAAIAARGYDDASLRKIAHENWQRVLRKTWREKEPL